MPPYKKKCLLTGYPGYVGSYLYDHLNDAYELHTLGMETAATPRHMVFDLGAGVPEIPDVAYDLVVHAAGKAHTVPRTDAEKAAFFRVNQQGTENLLGALDRLTAAPRAVVLVSTVAVYGREHGTAISENASLQASDPYGQSKLLAEEALRRWSAGGVKKGIMRLPLIAGENPPGNLGKMMRAVRRGRYFDLAGGKARRSFVWIDDVARFIPLLAERGGTYNLTDGRDATFAEVHEALCRRYGKRHNPSLPACMAWPMAWAGDLMELISRRNMPFNSRVLKKMTSDLTFSCEKVMKELDWRPTEVVSKLKGTVS